VQVLIVLTTKILPKHCSILSLDSRDNIINNFLHLTVTLNIMSLIISTKHVNVPSGAYVAEMHLISLAENIL